MKVIILCNGTDAGWNNHLGVPKQLIPIDGEPILHRTVRQLRERQVADITISTNNPLLAVPGVSIFQPDLEPYGSPVPAGFSTEPLWSKSENTLLLLGDVRFSDAAIDKILEPVRRWTFYCRFGPRYGKDPIGGEGWAVQFTPGDIDRYVVNLNRLRRRAIPGCHFWQHYRMMNGKDPLVHKILQGHVIIDDETEDFDYPSCLEGWLAKHPEHKVEE